MLVAKSFSERQPTISGVLEDKPQLILCTEIDANKCHRAPHCLNLLNLHPHHATQNCLWSWIELGIVSSGWQLQISSFTIRAEVEKTHVN